MTYQVAFGLAGPDPERYARGRLCGDVSKAEQALGWRPLVLITDLVTIMPQAEIVTARVSGEATVVGKRAKGRRG
jgi:hypothetical protein